LKEQFFVNCPVLYLIKKKKKKKKKKASRYLNKRASTPLFSSFLFLSEFLNSLKMASTNPFYELGSDIKGLLAIETFRVKLPSHLANILHCTKIYLRKMCRQLTLLRKSRQVLLTR
jgi:hypothetical protein